MQLATIQTVAEYEIAERLYSAARAVGRSRAASELGGSVEAIRQWISGTIPAPEHARRLGDLLGMTEEAVIVQVASERARRRVARKGTREPASPDDQVVRAASSAARIEAELAALRAEVAVGESLVHELRAEVDEVRGRRTG